MSDIMNPRRAPRVPLRCAVEVRLGLLRWAGETEDVGPGGCQIVMPHALDPGREVRLSLRLPRLGRTVEAPGRVVWSREEAPARLGIAFLRGADRGWFDALLRADAGAERASRGVPDRLPGRAQVYLGWPPRLVVDFSPIELELLRRVGSGVTLEALAHSFGPVLDDRTRGALFSLVARRFLVFDRARSVGVARWRGVLPDGEDGSAAAAPAREPDARSEAAQQLYDEALQHLGAGRLGLALDRLREALSLAPADETIARTVRRIERWA